MNHYIKNNNRYYKVVKIERCKAECESECNRYLTVLDIKSNIKFHRCGIIGSWKIANKLEIFEYLIK
jgi:hypothetical protein